jgi:type IV pilus assembly protein PilV
VTIAGQGKQMCHPSKGMLKSQTSGIRRRRPSAGFSLIEVLVSLLVLSFGLLGLAALQISGLKSSHMGFVRTQAAQLAYDIGDRMRANSGAATAGTYVGYTGSEGYTGTGSTSCVGKDNVCTSAELAEFDKGQWKSGVTLLPGGSGDVTASGDNFTISVCWDESGPGAAVSCPPVTGSSTDRVQLTIKRQ